MSAKAAVNSNRKVVLIHGLAWIFFKAKVFRWHLGDGQIVVICLQIIHGIALCPPFILLADSTTTFYYQYSLLRLHLLSAGTCNSTLESLHLVTGISFNGATVQGYTERAV